MTKVKKLTNFHCKPTLQALRENPVVNTADAVTVLQRLVAAASTIVSTDDVLWAYDDSDDGVLGFDGPRALRGARYLDGKGALLGWTLRAARLDKSVELGTSLHVVPRTGAATCVFSIKLPKGEYSLALLAESCGTLIEALGGETGAVWDEQGNLLESILDSRTEDVSVVYGTKYKFRVSRPDTV